MTKARMILEKFFGEENYYEDYSDLDFNECEIISIEQDLDEAINLNDLPAFKVTYIYRDKQTGKPTIGKRKVTTVAGTLDSAKEQFMAMMKREGVVAKIKSVNNIGKGVTVDKTDHSTPYDKEAHNKRVKSVIKSVNRNANKTSKVDMSSFKK